jgi:hypothetical protein
LTPFQIDDHEEHEFADDFDVSEVRKMLMAV